MALEENNGSIFSKFKKKQAAPPPPPPGPSASRVADAAAARQAVPPQPPRLPPPLPPPPPPVADARVPALEEAVCLLRAELEVLKNRPEPQAPPPPAPDGGGQEFAFRLVRAEGIVEELRRQLAAVSESSEARAAQAVSKDELKNMDLRLADLTESLDGLKRTFAREGELAARLETAERGLAEIRTLLPGRQAQVNAALAALAPKEEVGALREQVAAALAALEEMKRGVALYSEEFSGVEGECRKALGEMRGYVKAAEQRPLTEKFDEFLKDSVSKLSARLAEAETAMHAGLAELSGRFTSGEVLYKKMFTEAEDRVKKSVEPELKSIDGQLRWLRENMIRLSDDYTVVTERKIRALEGKYAAFEAIARRMDAIDAALKMGGRMGLP